MKDAEVASDVEIQFLKRGPMLATSGPTRLVTPSCSNLKFLIAGRCRNGGWVNLEFSIEYGASALRFDVASLVSRRLGQVACRNF